MPPGRKPIVTKHVTEDQIERVYSFLKKQVDAGRQAYVVYPVIEESETSAIKAAQQDVRASVADRFPELSGGTAARQTKTRTRRNPSWTSFKRGEVNILVSTTVIEVGVDVPNATVMVIEQAERFGLAQLHQLRGRVGRGAEQSYCILVTGKLNDAGKERIRTMVESNDGFYIAEMDMKLRGPGEFFGTQTIRPAGAAYREYSARSGDPRNRPQRGAILHRAPAVAEELNRAGNCLHSRSLAAPLRAGAGGLNARHRRRISQPQVEDACRARIPGLRPTGCAKRCSTSWRSDWKAPCFWMPMPELERLGLRR